MGQVKRNSILFFYTFCFLVAILVRSNTGNGIHDGLTDGFTDSLPKPPLSNVLQFQYYECTKDSDCDPCGSGDCAGNWKCVSGVCDTNHCNTEGRSCGSGNCGACNRYGGCVLKPGNDCFDGDQQACTFPLTCTYKYCESHLNCKSKTDTLNCNGNQTCSNCKWGACTGPSCCPSDECSVNEDCKGCTGEPGAGFSCKGSYAECVAACGSGNVQSCLPSFDCASPGCCCTCKTEVYCGNGKDEDADGKVDCADPDCAGKTGPGGVTCCQSDGDCSGYDPTTHLKLICDTSTHTCLYLQTLSILVLFLKIVLIIGAAMIKLEPKDCKSKGTILSVGGKSWLCDPPEGFVSLSEERNKPLTLFDFLINFFSNLFS